MGFLIYKFKKFSYDRFSTKAIQIKRTLELEA